MDCFVLRTYIKGNALPFLFFRYAESRAIRDVITAYGVFAYLTIHSYGQYLLYPWGWTTELSPLNQLLV